MVLKNIIVSLQSLWESTTANNSKQRTISDELSKPKTPYKIEYTCKKKKKNCNRLYNFSQNSCWIFRMV